MRWIEKPLGEVAYIAGRIGWKGLTAKEYTKEGPLFLSVHGLNYGDYVDFRDAFHISQERYDESPEIMLQAGDVLICKDGAGIGKLGIMPEPPGPTTINSSLLLIRAGETLDPKYLYYYLLSPRFQEIVKGRIEGATTPHLYQREISTFPILIPPLPEQKRIVAILDEAFEGIGIATANAEKNLANARELFQAELDQVWRMEDNAKFSRLEDVCERITVGHVGPMAARYVEKGIPFLRSQNVRPFRVSLDDVKYIDEAFEAELQKSKLRTGDVVVVRTGYPGTAAVVPPALEGANCADLVIIRCGAKLHPAFLVLLLNSHRGKALVGLNLVGAAQKHFNIGAARELELPIPGLARQADIADEVKELLEVTVQMAQRYAARIATMTTLKQSILTRAFSGQLTATKGLAA